MRNPDHDDNGEVDHRTSNMSVSTILDLQQQLLDELLHNNIEEFRRLLDDPAVNPGHKYGKPHYSTCLEIACRTPGCEEFVRELLKKVKPNINIIVPEPIHYAAEKGNAETLKVLLRDKRTKVNAEDGQGRTALHHAAKNFSSSEPDCNKYQQCIALLMTHHRIQINRPNKKGFTAIHEAALSGGKKAVEIMLKYGKQGLDLDSYNALGRTAREVIIEKYPDLRKELPFQRQEEISSESQNQLIAALKMRNLCAFCRLLHLVDRDGNVVVDPNYWYGKPHNTTCLEMACQNESCEKFVRALLKAGADPNMTNLFTNKSPIHVATETGNCDALKLLLNDRRTNVNAVDDNGKSALHCALEHIETEDAQKYILCVYLLLEHPCTNVNIADNANETPLTKAKLLNNEEIMKLMLQKEDNVNVDAPTGRILRDIKVRSSRMALPGKYPRSRNFPRAIRLVSEPPINNILIKYLYRRESRLFVAALERDIENGNNYSVNGGDGTNTFLQYACTYGLLEVAESLLNHGADPNMVYEDNRWPPAVLASSRKHFDILMLFLKLPPESEFDIDAADRKGNTALHYAAKHGNLTSVLALINNGADINKKNVFDKPTLPAKSVEVFLNQSITSDGSYYPEEDEYKLILNYSLLVPYNKQNYSENQTSNSTTITLNDYGNLKNEKNDQYFNNEMDFLFYLSKSSDHRPLLKHPIIKSFLNLKWHRICGYFYINLAFYCFFVLYFNLYILTYNTSTSDFHFNNSFIVPSIKDDLNSKYTWHILSITLGALVFLLTLRELVQLIMSPKLYVTNPENILDISLIICTNIILFYNIESTELRNVITVGTILMSWIELVLMTGRLPLLSQNIEMFKTVSWTFFQFLIWYSLIILAFAISFYTMFHNEESVETSSYFFQTPGTAVFKTMIMMTGEFESENIPFQKANIISHIVFLAFVFLIAIVLLNLLTGLAVSDTQVIQDNAEILSLTSQVQLIHEIENKLLQWHHTIVRLKIPQLLKYSEKWVKSIILFPSNTSQKHFCVLPNKGNAVSSMCDQNSNYKIDPAILAAAINIISNQGMESDIEAIKSRLDVIEKCGTQNKQILDQLLNTVSQN